MRATEALLMQAEQRIGVLEADVRDLTRRRGELREHLDEADETLASLRRQVEHYRKLAGVPEHPF